MFKINPISLSISVALLLFFFLHSCAPPYEKIINFQDESIEDVLSAQYIPEAKKIVIQTDDILSITVSTFDSAAAKVFNKPVRASEGGSFIGQGYLVDEDGYIEFPVLGKMKLQGLTRQVAKDTVRNRLLEYLKDPVVDLRFLNLHVGVMGEVRSPGIYTFSDEKFTLLEAITMAGDMTDFADRANILVIREQEKVREFGKVDMTSARAFESPYFYLMQNDMIYIKPLEEKAKKIDDPWTRILSITGVAATLATVVLALATL